MQQHQQQQQLRTPLHRLRSEEELLAWLRSATPGTLSMLVWTEKMNPAAEEPLARNAIQLQDGYGDDKLRTACVHPREARSLATAYRVGALPSIQLLQGEKREFEVCGPATFKALRAGVARILAMPSRGLASCEAV